MTATTATRTRERSALAWIGIGLGIVIIGAAVAVFSSLAQMPTQGMLDPDNPGDDGSRAITQILEDHGVAVTVAVDRAGREAAVGDGADVTLVVGDTAPLSDRDVTELLDSAADVVLLRPQTRDVRLAFDAAPSGLAEGSPVAPGCALPDAERAGPATVGTVYSAPASATRCYPSGDGFGLLTADRGRGRVVAFDGSAVITNAFLATDGNASLGVNLLGRHARVVWYLPSIGDSADVVAPPTLAELTPAWVTPAIILLLLSGIAAAVWRGRRFGPLVAENLPVTVRTAETTEGRARLYARAADPTHAADQVRIGTLRRLSRLLGLGPAASATEISDAAAARLGADAGMIRGILLTDPVPTDRDLVDLADRLRSLENTVTHVVRPDRPPTNTNGA
ncbi:DUF4350 domain-containing protein [Microbacterium sp.]|uniref:DUF4350 domain-containing protein n=1 Tax=Microbacterium sp. TaxID=51671 RepID=UPI003A8AA92B